MRVALLGPSFIPNRSYQENVWAEQLAKAGHAVRIIFAGKSTTPPTPITGPFGTFETQTVATRFLPRGTYKSRGLVPLVEQFNPDLIIVCGDKLFSLPVAKSRHLASIPLISTYSENLGMHEFDWRKPGITLQQRAWALAFAFYRGGPIRIMCRRSALIIGNTPQAREIILRLIRNPAQRADARSRLIDMPLGFSPDHFHFDPAVRESLRASWNLQPQHVLVAVSSAFTAVKGPYIAMIFRAMVEAMHRNADLRAVLIGFSEQPDHVDVSREVSSLIAASPFPDRFIKEPFAQRDRLSKVYNAADVAVFGRASISCQESLGTGLVACFPNDGSLNHLITRPDQGVFFLPSDQSDLTRALLQAASSISSHTTPPQRLAFRRSLEEAARWLGYDRIISNVLDQLRARGTPLPA